MDYGGSNLKDQLIAANTARHNWPLRRLIARRQAAVLPVESTWHLQDMGGNELRAKPGPHMGNGVFLSIALAYSFVTSRSSLALYQDGNREKASYHPLRDLAYMMGFGVGWGLWHRLQNPLQGTEMRKKRIPYRNQWEQRIRSKKNRCQG